MFTSLCSLNKHVSWNDAVSLLSDLSSPTFSEAATPTSNTPSFPVYLSPQRDSALLLCGWTFCKDKSLLENFLKRYWSLNPAIWISSVTYMYVCHVTSVWHIWYLWVQPSCDSHCHGCYGHVTSMWHGVCFLLLEILVWYIFVSWAHSRSDSNFQKIYFENLNIHVIV